jgi:hypothetical protein
MKASTSHSLMGLYSLLYRKSSLFTWVRARSLPEKKILYCTLPRTIQLQKYIKSTSFWRWYINRTITILDIWIDVNLKTDSQSASLSWCQAPIWDPWPIFLFPRSFLQTAACLLFCSALSDERPGL